MMKFLFSFNFKNLIVFGLRFYEICHAKFRSDPRNIQLMLHKVGRREGFYLFWVLFCFFDVIIFTSFYNHKSFSSFSVSVEPILVKTHGSFLYLQDFGDSPLFTQCNNYIRGCS